MQPDSAPLIGRQMPSHADHPPPFVLSKLRRFSSASGVEQFLLIGGAAIDPLVYDQPVIADWDIVIVDHTFSTSAIVRALERAAFTVGPPRDYQMNLTQSARCFHARHPMIGTFDTAIVEDLDFFGPFDLESLSVTYPAGLIVDDHDAIGALGAKRAKLIRPIERELPAMLAKRLFVLAGKYGVRFGPGSATASTAHVIRERLLDGPPPSVPNQAACLSKLLRGLARAERPSDLLGDAIDSGLVRCAIPPLDEVVRSPAFAGVVEGSRRPAVADLLAAIHAVDRDGRCASVLEAMEARAWDQL